MPPKFIKNQNILIKNTPKKDKKYLKKWMEYVVGRNFFNRGAI